MTRTRPPELMQAPCAAGSEMLLSSGTKLNPTQVPVTMHQRLSLMVAAPLVRVICSLAGASKRCCTGSLLAQVPLPLMSSQTNHPQSQLVDEPAVEHPLVLRYC